MVQTNEEAMKILDSSDPKHTSSQHPRAKFKMILTNDSIEFRKIFGNRIKPASLTQTRWSPV